MSIKFGNGEHHRNPSGFYNKVKYLLRESKRDPKKLYQIIDNISYYRNGPDGIKYYSKIRKSWETAYLTAQEMIEENSDNPREHLKSSTIYDTKTGKLYLKSGIKL